MFEWRDYLTLAERLVKSQDEASARTAVSRAYYAAFHTARRYVIQKYPDFKMPADGAGHEAVWNRLDSPSRSEKSARCAGMDLKYKRHAADYSLTSFSCPSDATYAIARARTVISNLAPSPPPSPIGAEASSSAQQGGSPVRAPFESNSPADAEHHEAGGKGSGEQ